MRNSPTVCPAGSTIPSARALYLYRQGRHDTCLRIHGTNDPGSLDRRVSKGCARMLNSHIHGLYDEVLEGPRVVLYPAA